VTPLRGLFVTGTDTGVGKTVLTAAIAASLRASGEVVAVFKPVVTGLDEPRDPDWPPDHELLGTAVGSDPASATTRTFGPPVSPHLAAEMEGRPLDPAQLVAAARRAGGARVGGETAGGETAAGETAAGETAAGETAGGETAGGEGAAGRAAPGDEAAVPALIVEGVGGLLVPLTADFSVRDLAVKLGLPLVVAARPGLGTINHTLLTVEAARTAGLVVAAVVLGPWPRSPSVIEASNRASIERLAGVEVATLPFVERATPGLLTSAARELPVTRWVR
jgi:dethiobiotin synthetase